MVTWFRLLRDASGFYARMVARLEATTLVGRLCSNPCESWWWLGGGHDRVIWRKTQIWGLVLEVVSMPHGSQTQ